MGPRDFAQAQVYSMTQASIRNNLIRVAGAILIVAAIAAADVSEPLVDDIVPEVEMVADSLPAMTNPHRYWHMMPAIPYTPAVDIETGMTTTIGKKSGKTKHVAKKPQFKNGELYCPKGALKYKPVGQSKACQAKMAKTCPDFGHFYNRPLIRNIYSHLEVAWEVNGVDEFVSCAYRAAGKKTLDNGSFKFLPETFAGVFKGVAPAHELAEFQKNLAAGLQQQWKAKFGHNPASSKWSTNKCSYKTFAKKRAHYKKALQEAWIRHFKGYKASLKAVWKKLKRQHFNDMMQALCDKLGDDSASHHMDALVKVMTKGLSGRGKGKAKGATSPPPRPPTKSSGKGKGKAKGAFTGVGMGKDGKKGSPRQRDHQRGGRASDKERH